MTDIFKQVQINHSTSGYILFNHKNKRAISIISDEDGIKQIMDMLPCRKVDEKPEGFKLMPKSYEDQFFMEI